MNIHIDRGSKIPSFEFNIYEDSQWVSRTTDEIFNHKRVVVFAIPGAFTPTCSNLHLPRYNELYEMIRSSGIDEIYCLAVNDSFVLSAWKKAEHADKITMLPDPDGEFSRRLGFLVDKSDVCLGNRSWRYSMVVNDGFIEKIFIEPEGRGSDPFGESSADNMLRYLNPKAEPPPSICLFTKPSCSLCVRIKESLHSYHLPFEELVLHEDFSIKTAMALTGKEELPIVFVNGTKFSSLEELEAYLKTRDLDPAIVGRFDLNERLLGT